MIGYIKFGGLHPVAKNNLTKTMPNNTKAVNKKSRRLRNLRNSTVFIVFVISLSSKMYAADANDGLQVLKQSESTLGSLSFTVECDWQGGMRTVVEQQKGVQGQFLVKKEIISTLLGVIQTNMYILNDSGYWHVWPDQSARLDFMKIKNSSAFCGILENGLDTSIPADYSMEKTSVNGREVFVVRQKPIYNSQPTGSNLKNNSVLESTFLIGCADNFLYGYSYRSANDSSSTMTVAGYSILPHQSDDIFEIQTATEQIVCTNVLQYTKIANAHADAFVQSPHFKSDSASYIHKARTIRYFVCGLMLVPPIILGTILLRSKRQF
jgi:hypothetical protein